LWVVERERERKGETERRERTDGDGRFPTAHRSTVKEAREQPRMAGLYVCA
jgi:hypothetical protein